MAGNELKVCEFIFDNTNLLNLRHLGKIYEIAAPVKESSEIKIIQSANDLSKISTESSGKKADIYLNRSGISIKQRGSFSFNRIQRANIIDLYQQLEFTGVSKIRRQWVGQSSSEHTRALGLSNKKDNYPWVFDEVVGEPNISKTRKRWRDNFPIDKRKTVYFLMIEKKR